MSNMTRVMIVEDDLAIAELHHRYLTQIGGFEVVAIATTKAEAEMQFELLKPELALLDVYLPDGTGLDILQKLRGNNQHCDVILITAARDVETLQQAMRGGVVEYLLKPVMFPRLEAALQKYQTQQKTLDTLASIDQSAVDQMLKQVNQSKSTQARLPKGIDGVTLEKIRALFTSNDLIRENESFTADEAGEVIGASRTTARRYLEFLISSGEVEADLNYGTVGRPERSYRKIKRG